MNIEKYSVYIKIDKNSKIIEVNSSAFLQDVAGYIKIDENLGDKYHHAQNNYFEKSITNMDGTHNYKFIDNKVIECSDEEKTAEKETFSKQVTTNERITAIEDALLMIL